MFTLYCDDSGTHSESPIAIAACLISTVDEWSGFLKDWCAATSAERIGVFHSADFEGGYPPFDAPEWKDSNKKQIVLSRLIDVLLAHTQTGLAVAVTKKDYDKVVSKKVRQTFHLGDNHYTFAFRTCIGHVLEWRKANKYTQRMDYVFDRMSKGKGEIIQQFDIPLKADRQKSFEDLGMAPDGYSFQDKAYVTPLQASDICAWEAYRYMLTVKLKPEGKKAPIRKSFKRLYHSPYTSPLKLRLHNQESLSKMIDLARKHQWSFGQLRP